MPVIVTRPAAEASDWVRQLRAQGIHALALPLIDIQYVDSPADCAAPVAAAMFVSPNAVRGFFRDKGEFSVIGYAQLAIQNIAFFSTQTRAWATGPGTRQALIDAHWPPESIDTPPTDGSQWDARALWPVVQDQVRDGTRVLVVQGQSDASAPGLEPPPPTPVGSAWLIEALRGRRAQVCTQVVYRRQMPAFTSGQRDLALAAACPPGVWLLSSSEAIANLRRWLPDASWAQAQAVATHPRIAQAAADAGFGRVTICKPLLSAVVASIESFA